MPTYLPSDDHLVSSAVHSVPETSAKENMSQAGKRIATLETIVVMKDFTAFNVSSYLESMALAGVRRHVVVAEVFFLVDMIIALSGNITREQAGSSLSRVINLPDVSFSVTVRGKGNHGRRTQFLSEGQEIMLEITLKTTDAQLALGAAQRTRDTAALTRAFTEQTAIVNSLDIKGCAQAVLVSTHVGAGQTLNSTMLSTTLSEKLGANVIARVLEDGPFDELLFAAADAAPPQEASEVERSGIDTSSAEVFFFTTLAAAAMVASCLLLIALCRWKLRSSQQSKVSPMHPAVPAWLP